MISNLKVGCGFGGALRYALAEDKGYLLDTNMAGQTAQELAAEFSALRELRPNLHRVVFHASLSLAPDETLTDAQWREIGQRYLHGMGYTDDNQYVLIRHTDTEHEHLHLIANRITHRGAVVSDSLDYARAATLVQELERAYGLQQAAQTPRQARELETRAPTQNEIERTLRTGEPSARQQLQELCRAAARHCHSFTDYLTRLESAGVEPIPVIQLAGAKIAGLSYRLDGVLMKGSDLGKAYSPAGLAQQGITYEQNRDFAAARHCLERETARAFGRPDRDLAASPGPERGGVERDLGTLGPSAGGLERRDARDLDPDRGHEPTASPAVPRADHHHRAALDADLEPSRGGRPSPRESREPDQSHVFALDAADRPGFSDARERILALAGTHPDPRPPDRRPGSREPAQGGPDRTARAVQKQAEALGGNRFEIGIRDPATGRMMNRAWSHAELSRSLPWLKRMNARGNDLYLRPAGEHAYVLVDDLNAAALQRMEQAGYRPAASLETSPGNYQAWVKLASLPVGPDIRRQAARDLAQQFGGDPNSADSRHYGRLAGFTNQKPAHRNAAGQSPYVLAHDCPGTVATAGPPHVQRIQERIEQQAAQREQQTRLEALQNAPETRGSHNPEHEYQRQAQRLLARYGPSADYSRMDWMIAQDMAKSGRFSQREIEQALRICSPHIEARKAGHIEDYAARTTERAWQAPDVVQQREQAQARQAERARAQGMDWGLDR